MITFSAGGVAVFPLASQAEIVRRLSPDMVSTEMVKQLRRINEGFVAILPLAEMKLGRHFGRRQEEREALGIL